MNISTEFVYLLRLSQCYEQVFQINTLYYNKYCLKSNIMRSNQINIESCPILQPTTEEFDDFEKYIEKVKEIYEKNYGMVKIVPPCGWQPRRDSYEQSLSNLMISSPIEQNPEGKTGVYEFKHINLPPVSYQSFIKQYADRESFLKQKSASEIEGIVDLSLTQFWRSILNSPPVYGADIQATLMDQTAGSWRLNNLNSVLSKGLTQHLKGINTSYCYIGSWKALFCWHKEDLDLDSINYLHLGKSKFWYCIQADDSLLLENQTRKSFFRGFDNCREYLRHKTCLINPYILKKYHPNIKIYKMEQKPRQFIIAFSGAYHCGFNFGINVAEAVNFATLEWLLKLRQVNYCKCKKSSVRMSIKPVLQQLDKYEQYRNNPIFTQIKQDIKNEQEDKECHSERKTKKIIKRVKASPGFKAEKSYRNSKKIEQKQINVEVKTEIQCDNCSMWHELTPLNEHLKDEFHFVCSMIGNQYSCLQSAMDQSSML